MARRLAAPWVVPVEGAPIQDGAVLLGDDGRIAAVGPADAVPTPPGAAQETFPGCTLIPGLVNAHTHLELTGLERSITADDFPDWIRQLRERKAARTPADFLAAARRGLADCHTAGVTTVADTGDSGAVIQALAEAGGSGIAYQEVFGPHPDQAQSGLAWLEERVTALRRFESARVHLGVSPHAPYSVSGALLAAVAGWARMARLPLAVHSAESAAERALLAGGTGPFADMWARREIPVPAPLGDTPLAWLDRHGVLGPETLCIHVVHADDADIALLAGAGAAVAHCPLSNRAHQHGDAPLAALLHAGIRVGVGTDSVVSVGRLDLLAEARAARQLAGLDAPASLALCTLDAARAIGLGGDVGSLAVGKYGDVVALTTGDAGDPVEAVLAGGPADVRATWLAGRRVFP